MNQSKDHVYPLIFGWWGAFLLMLNVYKFHAKEEDICMIDIFVINQGDNKSVT